jgi:hypothetical protein
MEMLSWTVILKSVHLATQDCEMKNCYRNTLEMRSGPFTIAFKIMTFFGSLHSIFVSMVIKKRTVRALDTILDPVDPKALKQTIHLYGNYVVDNEIKGSNSCSR